MCPVQVIADGFATFEGDYKVMEPNREIAITMLPPPTGTDLRV